MALSASSVALGARGLGSWKMPRAHGRPRGACSGGPQSFGVLGLWLPGPQRRLAAWGPHGPSGTCGFPAWPHTCRVRRGPRPDQGQGQPLTLWRHEGPQSSAPCPPWLQPSPLTDTALATHRLTRGPDRRPPSPPEPQTPPWGGPASYPHPQAVSSIPLLRVPVLRVSSWVTWGDPRSDSDAETTFTPSTGASFQGPPCSGESSGWGFNCLVLGLKVLSLLSVVPAAGQGGSSCKSCFGLSAPCSLGVLGSVNASTHPPPKPIASQVLQGMDVDVTVIWGASKNLRGPASPSLQGESQHLHPCRADTQP